MKKAKKANFKIKLRHLIYRTYDWNVSWISSFNSLYPVFDLEVDLESCTIWPCSKSYYCYLVQRVNLMWSPTLYNSTERHPIKIAFGCEVNFDTNFMLAFLSWFTVLVVSRVITGLCFGYDVDWKWRDTSYLCNPNWDNVSFPFTSFSQVLIGCKLSLKIHVQPLAVNAQIMVIITYWWTAL